MGQVHAMTTAAGDSARRYARKVRGACDELHADPFSPAARAEMLALIVDASPAADAALVRALSDVTH